jgi:hypothetical protein
MEKEEKKKSFWKSKIFLFAVLPLFVIGSVFAGVFLVNSIVMTISVAEPFTVEYAMLGDAGNYKGTPTCAEYEESTGAWIPSGASVPTGQIYPGESRKLCVRITNAGEGDIPYVVTSSVTGEAGCAIAFPKETLIGNAPSGISVNGKEFTIPADAPPVTGCQINISVSRGTLS